MAGGFADISTSGILTSTTQSAVQLQLGSGQSSWVAYFSGTFSVGTTIVFDGALSSSTGWFPIGATVIGTSVGSAVASITGGAATAVTGNASGLAYIRVRATAFAGGDAVNVMLQASVAPSSQSNSAPTAVYNSAAPSLTNGAYSTLQLNSQGDLKVTQDTLLWGEDSTDNTMHIEGASGDGNTFVGSPVRVGGLRVAGGVSTPANNTAYSLLLDPNGLLKVTDVATAESGSTPFHLVSAATTNLTTVKASAGNLYGYTISNSIASPRYVKFCNSASTGAVTLGTTVPTHVVQVPASSTITRHFVKGMQFSAGITFYTVTTLVDSGTTAVGAGDLSVDLDYA